jgi:hypothetical protein
MCYYVWLCVNVPLPYDYCKAVSGLLSHQTLPLKSEILEKVKDPIDF